MPRRKVRAIVYVYDCPRRSIGQGSISLLKCRECENHRGESTDYKQLLVSAGEVESRADGNSVNCDYGEDQP